MLETNRKRPSELCSEEIKDIKGDIRKERMRINKNSGNVSAEELEQEIEDLEETLEDKDIELNGILKNQENVEAKLEEISLQLSQLEDAAKLEQKRKGLERDLATAKKHFEQNTDQFFKRLLDGYALVTDKLVDDVKSSIENVDVPAGLTVEAVKNILKRPKCICGCDMNDDIVKHLTEMIAALPPDNISSTLLYMANQFDGEKKRAKNLLKESYKAMKDSEDEVANIKIELSEISSSLVSNVSDTIKQLEIERREQDELMGRLKGNEDRCRAMIDKSNKRLKEAKKELEDASGSQEQIKALDAEQNVLELFMNAIIKIGERNSELSLESINSYLTNAYTLLSESEIHERIVLEVVEGKSTGQSKVNSLAFAKAVLDYSNEDRTTDKLKVSHDYPFLIDSPFTELSGKNLDNVAQYIHTFANQIILMADDKSYGGVQHLVAPSVKSTARLLKDSTEGITYTK